MVMTSYRHALFQSFGLQENCWDLKKQNLHLVEPKAWVELSFWFTEKQE